MSSIHLATDVLAMLIAVGFCAGFVDAIAGGGGLLTVPALLTVGLPPVIALATNRLQGAMGELSASLQYLKHSQISFKKMLPGLIAVLLGSIAGTICVQYIHPQYLEKLIPILLVLVLIYLLIPQRKATKPKKPLLPEATWFIVGGLLIGFYNGFFGPATGTIWTASLLFLLAYELRKAIAYTKPLNLAGNLVSLVCFIIAGKVYYAAAICMGIGSFTGGRFGARFVIQRDIKLIKTVFTLAVILMTAGLFYKYY